jgi:hypothetical protein
MYQLLLGGELFNLQGPSMIANCHLFKEEQGPIEQPRYQVQSEVSRDSMRVFAHAIDGLSVPITAENAVSLRSSAPSFNSLISRRGSRAGRKSNYTISPERKAG